jgi:hypothetical protein
MDDEQQLGRLVAGAAPDLPLLWVRDRRGNLSRQVGTITMKVCPVPPQTPAERWGNSFVFRVRADGAKPYKSKLTFASEQEAVRQAILYVLAGLAPKGDEDDEPAYED